MKKYIILFFIFSFSCFSQEKLNIYFDFDKYDLNDDAIKKINSWIATGKDFEVTKMYGFCDWKGTNKYNDTLAVKRVMKVYSFLLASEITVVKDIEIRGFGEDFEQSKIQDENRRVTIIYELKNRIKTPIIETPKKEALKDRVKNAKKGDIIKLDNIYFFNNSARIVSKSETTLYDLWCVMKDNPNLKIEIQGHICCKSPDAFEAISSARARTVYNYLIRKRVDRNRMTFKGYGVTRPVHPIPEKNAQEEDDNRRVEIMIVEN